MLNFYSRFLESVERWPDGVALQVQRRDGTESYTYADVRRMAEAVAWRLAENGVPRGERCAILAANGPRWVATFLGVLAAGAVIVPLDTAYSAGQVATILRASGSSLLFTDTPNAAAARAAVQGLEVRVVLLEEIPPQAAQFAFQDVGDDELATISYTSGTTSDPKGVMLTHGNLRAETEAIFAVIHIGPADSIMGILPLFHVLALETNLLLPLAAGTRVLFLETLNTTELLRALPQVNIFVCVPQFFYLIHERIWKEVEKRGPAARLAFRAMLRISHAGRKLGLNLGKLFFHKVHALLGPKRYLATGGSRFDPQIGRDFEALGFTMLQAYGLTETCGAATYTPPAAVNIASVGRALPGIELKIVNPRAAANGGPEVGEVAIRGPIVMKGYYQRLDATAQALRDGWLHTGDVGYLDTEGNLFLTGREKDVIVLSSGKNVYPEELEEHYAKHPFIKEVCVVGLATPEDPHSERLHAVIVPKFDLLREKKIVNLREALRFQLESLSAQLPATKRILSYEIWPEDLPRTSTRKLKRFEIERRVREGQSAIAQPRAAVPHVVSDDDRLWLQLPEVQRALAVVREAAGAARKIQPSDNLELDLGLDSMQRVELLVALEQELGTHVPESVIAEVYTVRELVEAVRKSAPPGAAVPHGPAVPHGLAWKELLADDAPAAEVVHVMRRRPLPEALCFLFFRLLNLFARDWLEMRVFGLENLPAEGPVILCPNHQSFVDPMAVLTQLSWPLFRDMFSVGTTELFGDGWARRLGLWMRIIPVDPDAALVAGMRAAAWGLRRRKVLILYPEGERSIDGTPKIFHKGAAILAAELNVPICPIALDGWFEVWPRGTKFQGLSKLKGARVRFGELLYPPAGGAPEQKYEQLTTELRKRVVEMWEELRCERARR
jgi:long-chain acyl-CoA synthetase